MRLRSRFCCALSMASCGYTILDRDIRMKSKNRVEIVDTI